VRRAPTARGRGHAAGGGPGRPRPPLPADPGAGSLRRADPSGPDSGDDRRRASRRSPPSLRQLRLPHGGARRGAGAVSGLTGLSVPPGLVGENGDELFDRSEEHTSELQSRENLVWRLLYEKKKIK